MAAYRDRIGEITAAGARVAALSVDPPEVSAQFRKRYRLSFPILCDVDHGVITAWGALNRKERGGLALPSTWVIGADLTVRYRALERMTSRVDPDPVIRFLRGEVAAEAATNKRFLVPPVGASIRWVGNFIGHVLSPKKKK